MDLDSLIIDMQTGHAQISEHVIIFGRGHPAIVSRRCGSRREKGPSSD